MAGIGNQEYPEMTLTEAVAIAEKVGREGVKTKTGLIAVMGLKEASGYFYHKVSALTKYYGVLDRSLTNVALTPLGERIAHPLSATDRREALAEAAGRVSLLRALYDALGQTFHDADFRTKLRDVTQAPLPEIEKAAPYLEKLYRDAVQYMGNENAPTTMPSMTGREPASGFHHGVTPSPMPRSAPASHEPGFRTFEGDGVFLKIKKDPEALKEALATVNGWLTLHQKSRKGSDTDPGSGMS